MLFRSKLSSRFPKDKRFHAYNLALSNQEGSESFHLNDYSYSSSLLNMKSTHHEHFKETKRESIIEVKTSPLDKVLDIHKIKKNIFIKMDVQGAEIKVIQGATRILSQAKAVVAEVSFVSLYEGGPLFDELYQVMKGLGFEYHGSIGQLHSPVHGQVLQQDSLFLKA